jgi:hypothetical protein
MVSEALHRSKISHQPGVFENSNHSSLSMLEIFDIDFVDANLKWSKGIQIYFIPMHSNCFTCGEVLIDKGSVIRD